MCGQASGSNFEVDVDRSQDRPDISGQTVPVGNRPAPTTYVEKTYVPTCTGNTADDNSVLCNAALETCPADGDVHFWIFGRTVTIATGDKSAWTLLDTVCLAPDEPAIDPAVAVPAIVERDFKRVVVVKGAADVSPKPDTLVNVATRFRTDAPATYDIPLTLLGKSVVITARAERYTWFFGDGESASTEAAGGAVEHTYREAETRQAYVVIEWSGTFRVNGGTAQPIAGRATTIGDPVAVQVKQAHTELVRD